MAAARGAFNKGKSEMSRQNFLASVAIAAMMIGATGMSPAAAVN